MATVPGMSFFLALLVWIVFAVILAAGVVFATKGSFILLGLSMLAFLAAFVKYGCLSH
jgi:hypothetical protein